MTTMTEKDELTESEVAQILPAMAQIDSVLDPEALFPAMAKQLRSLVKYEALLIYVAQDDGFRVAFGEGEPKALSDPKTGGAQLVETTQKREAFVRAHDSIHVLTQPLMYGDRLVGVLGLEANQSRTFGRRGVSLVGMIAGNLATAIENANLHREARWYAGLLAMLHEAGKEMGSILDLTALCDHVAEVVHRVVDYEMFAIFLVDEKADELVLKTARQMASIAPRRRIALSEGLTGAAARSKEPVIVGDVRDDPRYIAVEPEVRSELVMPLVNKGRVVGVFDLESRELNRFTHEHIKVLTPLASQVAVAIENARLYEEISRRETRYRKELAIARRIQEGLFPEESPKGERWEASAHFIPARELAGDLFDFYHVDENHLGLSVGDVAGKGIPAALFGAFTSGTIRGRAFQGAAPSRVLFRANRTLIRRAGEGLYCALTYAHFDFEKNEVRIASSGLPYAIHFKAAEKKASLIVLPGVPLGLFDNVEYDELAIPLEPGDVFVFHSDGVTEAWNGTEEFGSMRLTDLITEHASKSPRELGREIERTLRDWAKQHLANDDVTFVIVRVT
ncbi:MAG: SpoIIE family protein phosphatase [Vicinamibacteria bacterium]|nr:SpoIIE family protein phosphatase [Vicinamibacteria bacterium]